MRTKPTTQTKKIKWSSTDARNLARCQPRKRKPVGTPGVADQRFVRRMATKTKSVRRLKMNSQLEMTVQPKEHPVSLVWQYSRNQLRHTAHNAATGDEMFHIKSERPRCEIRKSWHGFNLYTAAGAFIQHAKHVDVLKQAAAREANNALSKSHEI